MNEPDELDLDTNWLGLKEASEDIPQCGASLAQTVDPIEAMLLEQKEEATHIEKVLQEEKTKDIKANVHVEDSGKDTQEVRLQSLCKAREEEEKADRLPPHNFPLRLFRPCRKQFEFTCHLKEVNNPWFKLCDNMPTLARQIISSKAICLIHEKAPKVEIPPQIIDYLIFTVLHDTDISFAIAAFENMLGLAFGNGIISKNPLDPFCTYVIPATNVKHYLAWKPTPKDLIEKLWDFGFELENKLLSSFSVTNVDEAQIENIALYLRLIEIYVDNNFCDGWDDQTSVIQAFKTLIAVLIDSQQRPSHFGGIASNCMSKILNKCSPWDESILQLYYESFEDCIEILLRRVAVNDIMLDEKADGALTRSSISLSILERLPIDCYRAIQVRTFIAAQICRRNVLIRKTVSTIPIEIEAQSPEPLFEYEYDYLNKLAFETTIESLTILLADVKRVHMEHLHDEMNREMSSTDYHRWTLFLRFVGHVQRYIASSSNIKREKQMIAVTRTYKTLQGAFEKKFHLAFTHLQDLIGGFTSVFLPFHESKARYDVTGYRLKQQKLAFSSQKAT